MEKNTTDQNHRNKWLDILRGLAILGVVCVHSVQTSDLLVLNYKLDFFTWLISLGRYGVELFFFLSGWLLVSIYGFDGKKLGKAYLARRIARIYPLWILFLLIAFIRWEFSDSSRLTSKINQIDGQSNVLHSAIGIIILTLTFTLFISSSLWNSVIPGGWSIQAEVGHYLIFPIIRNRSLNSIVQIVTLINFLTSILILLKPKIMDYSILLTTIVNIWLRMSIHTTFCFFLIGVMSYLFFSKLTNSKKSQLPQDNINISINSLIFFFISFVMVGNRFETVGYLLLMLIIGLGIMGNKFLSSVFLFLGKHSYFIYFMHFIALASFNWITTKIDFNAEYLGSQQTLFLLVLMYTLAVSSIFAVPSMKYIEKPFIKLAHKII